MAYDISTNFFEIICGTTNLCSPVYQEAAKSVDKMDIKGMGYIKNFIASIEKMASKSKDERIITSEGNIKNLNCYEQLNYCVDFLKKSLGNTEDVKSINTLFNKLLEFQPQYSTGYDKKIRLIQLEYESFAYILITATTLAISEGLDVVENRGRFEVKKKNPIHDGPIRKSTIEAAKFLSSSSHKEYLDTLIKGSDEMDTKPKTEAVIYTEGTVSSTINLLDTLGNAASAIYRTGKRAFIAVKNSVFGIVPLMRSIVYLKYKKKADTIMNLEQQAAFLQQNIDRLGKMTTMDPNKKDAIIKKQQAAVTAYRKKAEKIRAQLMETEKDASASAKAEEPKLKELPKTTDDTDFVLEAFNNK